MSSRQATLSKQAGCGKAVRTAMLAEGVKTSTTATYGGIIYPIGLVADRWGKMDLEAILGVGPRTKVGPPGCDHRVLDLGEGVCQKGVHQGEDSSGTGVGVSPRRTTAIVLELL